jgi:16S rRNA (uracil1498-N3)-methyltransferase
VSRFNGMRDNAARAHVNLILLHPHELGAHGAVRLSGPRAEHLIGVLKVAPGHQVRVGVLDAGSGIGTVTSIADRTVELHCDVDARVPPSPPIDLLLAVPRPKVMRRLWAQLAALGVGHIILTNAARVERNYFDTHVLSPACYEPLLVEGLQQARDTRVPRVSIHRQFKILVEDHLDALFGRGARLVAHPGKGQPVSALMRDRAGERVLLAVGPEGGWNDFELNLLQSHGFEALAMGPRTLRTDTACIALLALAHEALR